MALIFNLNFSYNSAGSRPLEKWQVGSGFPLNEGDAKASENADHMPRQLVEQDEKAACSGIDASARMAVCRLPMALRSPLMLLLAGGSGWEGWMLPNPPPRI